MTDEELQTLLSGIVSLDTDIAEYLAPFECTGILTKGGCIRRGSGIWGGIIIATNGTNNATVRLYDNVVASGKQLIPRIQVTGSSNYGGILIPVNYHTGLTLYLLGSGASCTIYYK